MKNYLILCFLILSGCASSEVYNNTYQTTNPYNVQVLMNGQPSCIYDEIGEVHSGPSFGHSRALQAIKTEAAQYGADGIILAYNYYGRVGGIMYKCRSYY